MCEAKAIFNVNSENITILCKTNERFKDILKRLEIKIKIDINKVFFLYNGNKLDPELKYDEIINQEDKSKNIMNIIGYEMNNTIIKEEKKIISKNIICNKCKEEAFISINNYMINLSCKNGHIIKNIKINEFENTQAINLSKIKCNECNQKNKSNTYNNEFYKCINCNKNICPLCKMKHNNHIIINYDNINYICNKHKETFTRYCIDCKKNICMSCENQHKNHNGVNLGVIISSDNNYLQELKENIEGLKEDIKELINKMESIIINLETYYKISNNIINDNGKRNFVTLKNKNIFINNNNIIIKDIQSITNDKSINNKFNKLTNLYNKMNNNINSNIGEANIKEENTNEELKKVINSFGIFSTFEQLRQSPLITGYEYDRCYFLVHKFYSNFFGDINNNLEAPNFKEENLKKLEEYLNNCDFSKSDKKSQFDFFKKLINLKTNDEFIKQSLRQYTKPDIFCYSLNKCMRNLENGLKDLAYFIGPFIYELNKYVKKNPNFSISKSTLLYRNINCPYLEFFQYKLNIGHIISFPSFVSTCLVPMKILPMSLFKKSQDDNIVQIEMIFKYNYKEGNISPGIIVPNSFENEVILFPFTFAKICDIKSEIKGGTKVQVIQLEIINRTSYLVYTLRDDFENRLLISKLEKI